MIAREITKALHGRWLGSHGMARCPAHDDKNPSLSITERNGKLLTNCFGGCDPVAVWGAFKRLGLVVTSFGHRQILPYGRISNVANSQHSDRTANALARSALRFWNASIPATGTPAAEYLRCRGITIPPPNNIRFHQPSNALVAAVQQCNGDITGIQRVYLTTDAVGTWKRKRMSLGPVKGGAVRLNSPPDWDGALQITESVEDGLALMQMTGRLTWAVPGAGFMADVILPPEVQTVVLAPDNDEAGHKAIEKAEANLSGVVIRRLLPPPGMDWCSVLEHYEERAGIREFDGGVDRQTAEQAAFAEARL